MAMQQFRITMTPIGRPNDNPVSLVLGAVTAANCLRLLANRMDDASWVGEEWARSPSPIVVVDGAGGGS